MGIGEDQHDRHVRAATNQSLFREVNERVEGLNESFSDILPDSGDWVCECAEDTCTERVEMSVAEYEVVRSVPDRFLVVASAEHVWPDVERVVQRTERYWIVEKFGESGTLAKQTDPRARDGDGLPLRT